MSTCIRRSHSRWTTCQCADCTADRNRMTKLHRNGKVARVSSDAAWAKVNERLNAGWSPEAIASAAGLSGRYLLSLTESLREGKPAKIGPNRAAALVAMSDTPTAGRVDVTGSRRRLQALGAIGHSNDTLAERWDIPVSTLHVIKSGKTRSIHAHQYVAVRDMYEVMRLEPGTSQLAITYAKQRRYATPDGWTETSIDDPNARPMTMHQRLSIRAAQIVEDVEHLAASGDTLERVAERLGIKANSVERALRRNDRHDLIERMWRNDPNWIDPAKHITQDEQRRIVSHIGAGSGHGPAAGLTLRRTA